MKRSKILTGIVITIAACLLASAGLAGFRHYTKQQEVVQFRKLLDSYAESDYNHAFHVDNYGSYLDSQYLDGHEQQMEEYNDWYGRFKKQGHDIPLDEWVRAFEDERIQDKSLFIAVIDAVNQEYWKAAEQFLPVLDSHALSPLDRQDLCEHLQPSEEQRQQLERIQREWLEEIQVEDAMEFYQCIGDTYGYGYTEQVTECVDDILSNPGRYSNEKLVGAAVFKLNFQEADEIEAYSAAEKEQLAAILRTECRKLPIGELIETDAVNVLLALLALEKLEDIDWVLEELDLLEKDVSLSSWNQTRIVIDYLSELKIYHNLCGRLGAEPEAFSRIVKIMNKVNTLRLSDALSDSFEKVELYLNAYSDTHSDQPDVAQASSLLTREQTPQGFMGWQAVCDVDGDGLGDRESFEAMSANKEAVYDVAFANGDQLHYAFPVRIPCVYERKNADLNGDGINEVIVYFYMDTFIMSERYGITLDDIPDGSVEPYSTMAAKEPAGIVVFSKRAGETIYKPVLTKEGTTMVTDIFKEQSEYGCARELDEDIDWVTQLVWD